MADTQLHTVLASLLVQRYRGMTRVPYGAEEALQNARRADENSTQRMILEESELAWRVYHAAIKASESSHGFSGKAELTGLLRGLNAQPDDQRQDFAIHLAVMIEDEEINKLRQIVKRRRTTVDDHSEASLPSVGARPTNPEHSVADEMSGQAVSNNNAYVGAPLKIAQELFCDQFWDSVQRIPSMEPPNTWLADISMVFPQGHTRQHLGCPMGIGIPEEKVAELAITYFGVKVEIKDGVRSVRYPGGGKIEPNPSIKLRACRQDLSGMFRGDLYEAACTSPIYEQEKTEVRNRTDGVSLTISNKAEEDGRLTVFLGERRALAIKSRLYG